MTREAGPWEADGSSELSDTENMAAGLDSWEKYAETAAGMKAMLVGQGFTAEHGEQLTVAALYTGFVEREAAARVAAAKAEVAAMKARRPAWLRR